MAATTLKCNCYVKRGEKIESYKMLRKNQRRQTKKEVKKERKKL